MATQTKEEVLKHIESLLPRMMESIMEEADKALDTGAIELSDFDADGKFKLPKMLLSVVLEKQVRLFAPPHPTGWDKKFLKNLRNFI